MKSLLLLLLLVFAGCASARSTVVAPDVAVISGRGSKFNDQGQVIRAAMRSAAKTTLDKGYRYFLIVETKDTTRTGVTVMPGRTYTTTTGTYGHTSFSAQSRSHSTPSYVTPNVKPGVDFMIRMFREDQAGSDTSGLYDANAVLAATK